MKRVLPLLAALALVGCATAPPPPLPGPTAGFGEVADTGGPRVRPRMIVEDSRCPINAVCVWAGRLVVRADVFGPTWSRSLDLELGKPSQVADGTLTLVAAEPGKLAGVETDPRAYRFTFRFDGGL